MPTYSQNFQPLTSNQLASRQVIQRDLPTFNGRPEEWPLFISFYENTTRTCGYTDEENLYRLQKSLKGSALESVRFQLMIPSAVPNVISTLRMLYGRPEQVIFSLMDKIRNEPAPKSDSFESLIRFALNVKNVCSTVEASCLHSHLANPMLLQELINKLPSQIRLNWAVFQTSCTSQVTLQIFSKWLSELAEAASSVTVIPILPIAPDVKKRGTREKGFVDTHSLDETEPISQTTRSYKDSSSKSPRNNCYACQKIHPMKNCGRFKKLSLKDRWDIVKNNNLCRRCFGEHKTNKICRNSRTCDERGCQRGHNPLLHNDNTDNSTGGSSSAIPSSSTSEPTPSGQSTSKITVSSCNAHQHSRQSILFRVVPVTLYGSTSSLNTFAFLDEGLNLTGTSESLCLKWTGDTVRTEEGSRRVAVEVSNQQNGQRYKMRNVRTVTKLNLPLQSIDPKALARDYPYLAGIPLEAYDCATPTILIGIDNWKLRIPSDVREGAWNEPMATRTRLGWIVHGCYNRSNMINVHHSFHHFHACECGGNEELQQMVKQFFALESIGVDQPSKSIESKDDQRSKEIMVSTTKRIGDRFQTGLLWKYVIVEFPESLQMARHRLICLEKKMVKDPNLKDNITRLISDYLAKGYARKLTEAEIQLPNPRVWYLQIFTVSNANKPGKIRLVWDAAAKVNNISLNSMLLTGPDLLTSLPGVLHRFRESPIAICGDIREMFHQVRIRKEDQDSQRFLWRNGDSKIQPEVYVMNVMTFGATCSPSSAQFVKNGNAAEFAAKFPRAAQAIINNHYVDDWLDCCDTVSETIQLAQDVKMIHSKAGFHITNWISNSSEVLNALGEAKSSKANLSICLQSDEKEKVLGIWWQTATDEFVYDINYQRLGEDILMGLKQPTKRQVLKILMSIFDPLEFLFFFTVYIKILLREIWHSKVDWDQQITEGQFEKWLLWVHLLPRVRMIRIPRCYSGKINSNRIIQLHVFVDASENAIAAVGYFRIENMNLIECSMIGARTKVAPQQILSIPRLELQAAALGARLANTICKNHTLCINQRFLWSDSKTVLSWLNSEARNYRQFFAHRISEIAETTSVREWRWVPTKFNVADDATKWQKIPDLSNSSRWFKGPGFLLESEDKWPKDIVSYPEPVEELRLHYAHASYSPPYDNIIDITRFSNWTRLVRTVTFILRFIHNAKSKLQNYAKRDGLIVTAEFEAAENILYKIAQADVYMDEIVVLRKNEGRPTEQWQNIDKHSPLYSRSPYLDESGVLRMRGRIDAAPGVTMATKRPVLMPKSHHLTKLIVNHYHRRFHHHNNETTVNKLKQKFCIPNVRVVLKIVKRSCPKCKINRATPAIPEMGVLPDSRLMSFIRPFSYIGVDYFGPILVCVGRRSEKRWGVLITCMSIRAIHIEIAHTLTTDSCIMCLQNFIARRGKPLRIHCDNGTNFHGAENELKRELESVDVNRMHEKFVDSTTEWVFNPPASPHMGGSWERLVRSVKNTLYAILPTRHPNDELLRNLLLEVENVVNSRPLTYVPLESDDEEAITPNHFLLGSSSGTKPFEKFTDDVLLLRKNWKIGQHLTDRFWRRWVHEYLPTLTRRTRWFKAVKPIEVGDVVIVIDENNPRNSWPRGIVLEAIPGRDGQVRKAVVKTSTGVYTRPATKIAVLDVPT